MTNRVCEILGITKPVVQAPMTWITNPELVAAVSNAGGLGVLGFNGGFETGRATPGETAEEMRKVIRKTKALTDKPFGMNVMTAAFDGAGFSRATIQVCKEEGVPVLVAIGALDAGQVKEWKDAGFKVIYRDMYPPLLPPRRLKPRAWTSSWPPAAMKAAECLWKPPVPSSRRH